MTEEYRQMWLDLYRFFETASKTDPKTPAWQKLSAITCRVTVFPVPVAPATSPCLLAIFPTMERGPFSQWAIQSPLLESYIYH